MAEKRQIILEFEARIKDLERDLGKIEKDLGGVQKAQKQTSNTVGKANKDMISSFKNLAQTIGIALAADQFLKFGKAAINAATDLNETFSKVNEVFKDSAKEIIQWSETSATAFGMSQREALDAASTFAIFGKSAGLAGKDLTGFSKELTELSADFASFFNTSPEEAITAIGAALRGESEPIRRYGVLLDEATLKQRALSEGIITTTKGALTPQQKVLAAQAEILAQAGDAAGDFARTADQVANQTRIAQANLANLTATMGDMLLPAVDAVVSGFNNLISFITDSKTPLENERELFNQLGGELLYTAQSSQDRIDKIEEMQRLYPDFLKNIDAETVDNETLRKEIDKGNTAYQRRIFLAELTAEINEQQEKGSNAAAGALQMQAKMAGLLVEAERELGVEIDKGAGGLLEWAKAAREQLREAGTGSALRFELTKAITNYQAAVQNATEADVQLLGMNQDLNAAMSLLGKVFGDANEEIKETPGDLGDAEAAAKKLQKVLSFFSKTVYDDMKSTVDGIGEMVSAYELANQIIDGDREQFEENEKQRSEDRQKQADEELRTLQQNYYDARELYREYGMTEEEFTNHQIEMTKARAEALVQSGDLTAEEYEKIITNLDKLAKANDETRDKLFDNAQAIVSAYGSAGEAIFTLFSLTTSNSEKSANFQKQLALFQIIVQTAEAVAAAVTAAFKDPTAVTVPQKIAYIAAGTATVLANMARARALLSSDAPQSPEFTAPEFGQGGMVDGRLHSQGGTIIEAERGEYVINRKMTQRYKDAVMAINKGNFDDFILKQYIAPLTFADQASNRSFADNVAESLMHKQAGYLKRISKGVAVTNIKELAKHMKGANINRFS